jgi:hypothetical protein
VHKKKKFIVYGLVLLSLCWIGNIIYYNNKVLKKPIFLEHYYDIPEEMSDFNLYYIQNINSKDQVARVVFPEVGQTPVFSEETDNNDYNDIDKRYYVLKIIKINIYNGMSNMPAEYKNKTITKAQVQFSSGKSMNVNLGKIYFNSDEGDNNGLEQFSSLASNDNTGNYSYRVKKDIMITGINCKLDKAVKDMVRINVDGKFISNNKFPIKLKAGCGFYIVYKMNLNKNNAYFFNFDILTEDLQGNKGSTRCFIGTAVQPPEDLDVDTLKKTVNGSD